MGAGRMRFFVSVLTRAVMNRLRRCRFMVNMAFSPHFMGAASYYFCSGWLVLLQLGKRHVGRHRVAEPATQGQQGDHEGDEQDAHR